MRLFYAPVLVTLGPQLNPTLAVSNQDASFELSKSTIGQFFRFFTQRGDPYDLGGVQMYPHP